MGHYFNKYSEFLLLVSAILVFTSGINLLDIYSLDEVKNAVAAKEMLENQSFYYPTFNNELRTDKPPLHYFFMMLAYKIFGVTPFAARLFSSLMGVLVVLAVYYFVKKAIDKKIATYAALLLLASLHFGIQMHMAVPDPYLIFFLTLAGFSFYFYYTTNKRIWWWLFYIAIGFGILSKGPIALVLPGLSVILFLFFNKDFNLKSIIRINPFGILISLAMAFPWFWMAHIKTNGEFTNGFFLKHNIERFNSGLEGHGGLFFVTLLFVFFGLLPFLFFLFQYKGLKKLIQSNSLYLWSFCYAITIILFFMFSGTKLPNYTVPAYPWLFIILAGILLNTSIEKRKKYLLIILVFSVIMPLGVTIGLGLDAVVNHLYYLGIYFGIITIGAVVAYFYRKTTYTWINSIIISWIVMQMVFFNVLYPLVDKNNPVAKTKHFFENQKIIVAYKAYNPAFIFELKHPITHFKTEKELVKFTSKNSQSGIIITRLNSKNIEMAKRNKFKIIAQERDIFEQPTTLLLSF